MNPLAQKRITLGVTGSIAAYKAAEIASKLTQADAMVDVVLTPSAERFISPLTFSSVTGRKVFTDQDLWGGDGHVIHIGLGHGSDLIIIAPCSATTIVRLAHGMGDNLLSLTSLASRCPIIIAPAMDGGMFSHPATQANIHVLQERGITILGPVSGHLASGQTGVGRMVEPTDVIDTANFKLSRNNPLAGKKVIVTAGGTQEPIDPVRRISNRSSGKQGYALAQAALNAGADVILITAPTALQPPFGCYAIQITTASEMLDAVMSQLDSCHTLIMAAAVADFRPAKPVEHKIKKHAQSISLDLEPTQDILRSVADVRQNNGSPKYVIGFAAETQELVQNSMKKIVDKSLDMIVANDVTSDDAGFGVDTNRVSFFFPNGRQQDHPLQDKMGVAEKIIKQIIDWS